MKHSGEQPHVCERPHSSETCGKAFSTHEFLMKHIIIKHPVDTPHVCEKLHVCETCSKTFSTPGSLARHRRTHTGVTWN